MQKKEHFITSLGINIWPEKLFNTHSGSDACLVIVGAGESAMFWGDSLCYELGKEGYSVIRFDHHD
ncbi:MAG: hypothetical protein AAF770_00795 [Bacteroidota bacterium]